MRRTLLLILLAACGRGEPVDRASAAESAAPAFRRAAGAALPGVVFVEVQARRDGAPGILPALREGTGSGFVYREDGYIVTNDHVVEDAARVRVVTQDRREWEARVVGRDPNTDLAVLHVDARLPALTLGRSDSVGVGDWVVALGYPLQLGATATAGIVSAKGRNLQVLSGSARASAPIEHFIQTDAAINVGNSGGPLVDLDGRVVGVNSAIASPTGYFSGYGFAVPIDLARRVVEDLIRFGEVHRPRLGVSLEDVDPADADVYGLTCVCGAEVIHVTDGTPAAEAGLALGDVVRALDGTPVDRAGELLELLARAEPGRTVRIGLIRAGEAREVAVTLGEFPPAVPRLDRAPAPPETGLGRLGFSATEISPSFAKRLGLPEGGVVVSGVDPSHPAGRTRLQPGVRIERVNGRVIGTLEELRAVAEEVPAGSAVSIVVVGQSRLRSDV